MHNRESTLGLIVRTAFEPALVMNTALTIIEANEPLAKLLDVNAEALTGSALDTIIEMPTEAENEGEGNLLAKGGKRAIHIRMQSFGEQRLLFLEPLKKTQTLHTRQDNYASMSEMVENIAHQWRQPLNIMALIIQDIYISVQLSNMTHEKMETNYEKANNILQYMSDTIDDFRNLFYQASDLKPFNTKLAIRDAVALVEKKLQSESIELNVKTVDAAVIGSYNEFIQVIVNLLNNAKDAIMQNGAKRLISIDMHLSESKLYVNIEDSGGGVEEALINKIFDPYFTTKHKTMGTGIGLFMSKQIIEKVMQGKLGVTNAKEGARFEITVPLTH